jgi:hypothetical protein
MDGGGAATDHHRHHHEGGNNSSMLKDAAGMVDFYSPYVSAALIGYSRQTASYQPGGCGCFCTSDA